MPSEFHPIYEKLLNQPYIIPENDDERETLEALRSIGQVVRLTCPYEHYRIIKTIRIALSQIGSRPKIWDAIDPMF